MAFRVGQKVVCIKRGKWTDQWASDCDESFPVFGEVYTIRHIEHWNNETWLRFFEIVNPPLLHLDGAGECVFLSDHFRPIVENKTDISIFNEILRKASKVRETAE